MILKLALKNIISRKSSIVIIMFIAFAISLLLLSNSVFDSTENGIQESFVNSFTGDIVIRPKSETPLSLLGDETPVTGSFTILSTISNYEELHTYLDSVEQIKSYNPQISGSVVLDFNDDTNEAILFGTNSEKYLEIMKAIKLLEGRTYFDDEKGAMLSTQIAEKIGAKVGDELQFIIADGLNLKIRASTVTGIYQYPVENSVFDKIVLINSEVARDVFGINSMYDDDQVELNAVQEGLLSLDMDDMFGDFDESYFEENFTSESAGEEQAEEIQNTAKDTSTTWNFVVCKLENPKDTGKVLRKLRKDFKKRGLNVEAVNWRTAAGSNAMYLYFLRLILDTGIIIILFAGFIVINNTLVVNILDRIREIGTMRAIGTSKGFISLQCMSETLILSLTAGVIGIIIGIILSRIVLAMQISIDNGFLIQLFGGETLVTIIKLSSLLKCFAVAFILGMIAWIRPVHIALRTSPVTAMQGVK